MAMLKCKMCGGDIQATDNTYGTCESCGSTMTLPKAPDEQKVNLFNRANNLRRQNEFDKAMAAFENILNLDATAAEAHWGLVLSKFGIEYVEDPATGQRVPTCHRVQSESILTDADYLSALDNAEDEYTRSLYEEEAKRISEIQKGILSISTKEDPYDVFICYKETTDGGSRTKDSALAQDMYYQLEKEGYKVFFSRISLESKLGQLYEPYIFNALNSAKVMLVVGTKPEYFNAVWVKNEWSRFLAIMKKDRSRLLIPCYRDMDAYDLPEEMAMLQSQDMARIGFMQDIMHGIKKVLDSAKENTSQAAYSASAATAPGVDSLMKRGWLFLEDSDWNQADEYFDKVLDIDPEHAPAYIGKLCAELKIAKEEQLGNNGKPISDISNFQKALRFSDTENQTKLKGYDQKIRECLREEEYDKLVLEKASASTEDEFLSLVKKFNNMKGFENTAELASECQVLAVEVKYNRLGEKMYDATTEDEYLSLVAEFQGMSGYKNTAELASECQSRAVEAKYIQLAEEMHEIYEGDLQSLAQKFRDMNGYKDSAELADECDRRYHAHNEEITTSVRKEIAKDRMRVVVRVITCMLLVLHIIMLFINGSFLGTTGLNVLITILSLIPFSILFFTPGYRKVLRGIVLIVTLFFSFALPGVGQVTAYSFVSFVSYLIVTILATIFPVSYYYD